MYLLNYISVVASSYRVVVYNVFIERGNVGVLACNVPAQVSDHVQVLGWWRHSQAGERKEIHSGGRYLVTTSGRTKPIVLIILDTV